MSSYNKVLTASSFNGTIQGEKSNSERPAEKREGERERLAGFVSERPLCLTAL